MKPIGASLFYVFLPSSFAPLHRQFDRRLSFVLAGRTERPVAWLLHWDLQSRLLEEFDR